jgi:hypothetical protein
MVQAIEDLSANYTAKLKRWTEALEEVIDGLHKGDYRPWKDTYQWDMKKKLYYIGVPEEEPIIEALIDNLVPKYLQKGWHLSFHMSKYWVKLERAVEPESGIIGNPRS